MPGPNLQINMARMGPPVIANSAPVVTPNVPQLGPNVSQMSPGAMAAQATNCNMLRGFIPRARGCAGCSPDGPSLRDVAPPSLFARLPKWALWVGGLTGLGVTAGLIYWLTRRR